MEDSALGQAIADEILARKPSPPPDLFGLQGFQIVEAMVEWLDLNTVDPAKFPLPLIGRVLAEVFPDATYTEVRVAVDSIERRWLHEHRRAPHPDDDFWREIGTPVDNYSASGAGDQLDDFLGVSPYGKPVGLKLLFLLVPVLLVTLIWALS